MFAIFKAILHIVIIILLTIVTQIGGLVWLINLAFYRIRKIKKSNILSVGSFTILYLIVTLFVVPPIAKLSGRVALPFSKSGNLIPHNYITPILNRHYVKKELKTELIEIANSIDINNKSLKVSYLDANFPFIDGFPLLPHISHNDGKKVDLSFYYSKNGQSGNAKPSNSGYGKYVEPYKNEINQTNICKSKGHWQYDFTKYLTLGSRSDLDFDQGNTKLLVNLLLKDPNAQMILIEPHLKKRLNLNNNKIRFHGCHAVRHDDHIHYQINQ